jgi:hypothetical protein
MSSLRPSLASLVLIMLGVAGCTHVPVPGGPTGLDRSLIAESDIDSTRTESVYEMIERVRPEFLRVRQVKRLDGAEGRVPPLAVLVDGAKFGELADLRMMQSTAVRSVRFYNVEQAQLRFGMQYAGGVLELVLRAPSPD